MRQFYFPVLLFLSCLAISIRAQNVGINTESPDFDLDIRGTDDNTDGGELQLSTPSQTNFLRFFGGRLGDHHPFMAFHDDDTFHIVTTVSDWSTYARRMTWLPTGYVGINTEIPMAELDVRPVNVNTGAFYNLGNVDNTHFLRLYSGSNPYPGPALIWPNGTPLRLGSDQSGFTERMRITSAGLVGIGLIAPAAALHVKGVESNGSNASLMVTTGTGIGEHTLFMDGNEIDAFPQALHLQGNVDAGVSIAKGGGNVAVGESPTTLYKLSVKGHPIPSNPVLGSSLATFSIFNDTLGVLEEMVFDGNSIETVNNRLEINRFSTHNVVIANGGGNVGIGTVAPNSRLTIGGPDNNGITAGIEITSPGNQKLLLDGNEIDATQGSLSLILNYNSNKPVTINTASIASGYSLCVGGRIIAEEVRVQLEGAWPDYVFAENYNLASFDELKSFIAVEKHLPGMPAAAVIEADGLILGEMQKNLVEKVEELTLYILQLEDRIRSLESQLASINNPR